MLLSLFFIYYRLEIHVDIQWLDLVIADMLHCYYFSNLELSVMMTGSWTEEGFVKIPLQVELEFGKGYHVRLYIIPLLV